MPGPNTGYGPSVAKVIEDAIDTALLDVHTCLPARVTEVDVVMGVCNVIPVLKTEFSDGTVVELPPIVNVPIATYRAGTAFISLPLKVGDMVMLLFSERSLDIWQTSGEVVDPVDPRKFDLSDAIAYPGVYAFTDPPVGADPDNIVIRNDLSTVSIAPNGKFLFQGAIFELMQTMVDLATALISATTVDPITGVAPFDGATITAITNVKEQLEALKI